MRNGSYAIAWTLSRYTCTHALFAHCDSTSPLDVTCKGKNDVRRAEKKDDGDTMQGKQWVGFRFNVHGWLILVCVHIASLETTDI